MKNKNVFMTYATLVQKVHDQDTLLLHLSAKLDGTQKPIARFDRATLRLLRLNLAKHLARCRVLRELGLKHLLVDEGKYVSVAQRVLRSCRLRHPELLDLERQESFIGQLEVERSHHGVQICA